MGRIIPFRHKPATITATMPIPFKGGRKFSITVPNTPVGRMMILAWYYATLAEEIAKLPQEKKHELLCAQM